MKYIAIIDTDDYKDFEFFEDGNGKYMAVKDAGATANGGWIPLYFKVLEQELILDKPHIKGDYYDGFKNGLRTAEWRYDKIRTEIEQTADEKQKHDEKWALGLRYAVKIIDKYKAESEIIEMVCKAIDKYKVKSEE